jgi:ribosomal protein S27AE
MNTEEEKQMEARAAHVEHARKSILQKIGPWKKGTPATHGTITCPKCGGVLMFSRNDYNGHLRGVCRTAGCVQWIE